MVMVTFGLGCEEATNAHRNCTGNKFGNATHNDKLGFPE